MLYFTLSGIASEHYEGLVKWASKDVPIERLVAGALDDYEAGDFELKVWKKRAGRRSVKRYFVGLSEYITYTRVDRLMDLAKEDDGMDPKTRVNKFFSDLVASYCLYIERKLTPAFLDRLPPPANRLINTFRAEYGRCVSTEQVATYLGLPIDPLDTYPEAVKQFREMLRDRGYYQARLPTNEFCGLLRDRRSRMAPSIVRAFHALYMQRTGLSTSMPNLSANLPVHLLERAAEIAEHRDVNIWYGLRLFAGIRRMHKTHSPDYALAQLERCEWLIPRPWGAKPWDARKVYLVDAGEKICLPRFR